MGTYDILSLPNCRADGEQIKIWYCDMKVYQLGDLTPPMASDWHTYGIVLPSGGVAVIRKDRLVGWTPWPMQEMPLFDKWGGAWEGNTLNTGMLDSPYFSESREYEEWRNR